MPSPHRIGRGPGVRGRCNCIATAKTQLSGASSVFCGFAAEIKRSRVTRYAGNAHGELVRQVVNTMMGFEHCRRTSWSLLSNIESRLYFRGGFFPSSSGACVLCCPNNTTQHKEK